MPAENLLKLLSVCVLSLGMQQLKKEFFLLTPPMKMEQPERSETSAYKIQTPGNNTKVTTQFSANV